MRPYNTGRADRAVVEADALDAQLKRIRRYDGEGCASSSRRRWLVLAGLCVDQRRSKPDADAVVGGGGMIL
jgi:hypothetical protein